jgi:hypothetical protein
MNTHDPDFMTAQVTVTYKVCLSRSKDRQKQVTEIASSVYEHLIHRDLYHIPLVNLTARVVTDDDYVATCSARERE